MDVLWLFAPGAGLPSTSPWMTRWSDHLAAMGPVVRFDYPYRLAGRNRPDRLPVLVSHHREEVAKVREAYPNHSIVLIGKSMGSRVGVHVALVEEVRAVVCLGYPLLGGGDPTKRRDAVLRELQQPILFVQGTRDRLCPLPDLEALRPELDAPNALHIVQTGDHSLVVTKTHTKTTGITQDAAEAEAIEAVRAFVRPLALRSEPGPRADP